MGLDERDSRMKWTIFLLVHFCQDDVVGGAEEVL